MIMSGSAVWGQRGGSSSLRLQLLVSRLPQGCRFFHNRTVAIEGCT